MGHCRVACAAAELEDHFGDTTSAHFAFTFTKFSSQGASEVEERAIRRTVRVAVSGTVLATDPWLKGHELEALFWRAGRWAEAEARQGVIASPNQVQLLLTSGSIQAKEMTALPSPKGWVLEVHQAR